MLKAHSSHKDFKRLKGKVGRKIEKTGKDNKKSIKVSTKKLQLTEQLKNEDVTIPGIISRLNHYSGVARLTAIQELKNTISKVSNPDEYVSQIIPPSLENLFDEESDTRKTILEFYLSLFALCSAQSFLPVMPVIVTYICSGLTNLSRGIRGCCIHFLFIITTKHPTLLLPYHSKLIEHIMLLFKDTSQLNSVINNFRRESAKKSENVPKTESVKNKVTFLICILHVLQSFFRATKLQNAEDNANVIYTMEFDPKSPYNGMIQLMGYTNKSSRLSMLNNNGASPSSSNNIPTNDLVNILGFLTTYWSGLTLTDSVLSNESITIVQEICSVVSQIGLALTLADSITAACVKFLEMCFRNFPYISLECTTAMPNSTVDKSSRFLAQSLNISLCELVLQLQDRTGQAEYSLSNQYLLDILELYISSSHNVSEKKATDEVLPLVQLERTIRSLGVILIRRNKLSCHIPVNQETLHTLQIFHRILLKCAAHMNGKQTAVDISIVLVIFTSVCDFTSSFASSYDDYETSGLVKCLLDILATFIQFVEQIPNEPGYYTERVLSSILNVLRLFLITEESTVVTCTNFMRDCIVEKNPPASLSSSLYLKCELKLRLLWLDIFYYLPKGAFDVILGQLIDYFGSNNNITKHEMQYLFDIVSSLRSEDRDSDGAFTRLQALLLQPGTRQM